MPPKTAAEKKKAGRPKKHLDWEQVQELCYIQCTIEEICNVVKVSRPVLYDRAVKELGRELPTLIKEWSAGGKKSLRRVMFYNAVEKNNTTMQIWLSKQYLGMSDKIETDTSDESKNIAAEMKALAKAMKDSLKGD